MSQVQTTQHGRLRHPSDWEVVDSEGLGPFESKVVYRLPDGSTYVWELRRHRKGRGPENPSGQAAQQADRAAAPEGWRKWLGVWAPHRISWWVAVTFAVGSVLFIVGALTSLAPALFGGTRTAGYVGALANWTGALIFTASIYLWLLEGINADDHIGAHSPDQPQQGFAWIAWQPRRLEFLAPLLFLLGSLLFNVETTLAVGAELTWFMLPQLGNWMTLIGALLFLVPSYLQLVELSHGFGSWQPHKISWWVVVSFIVGSVGFVIAGVFGFDIPGISSPGHPLETLGLLQGAAFFLIGSYLMLPELVSE